MKITNRYNLPEAFVNAVASDHIMVPDRISVTSLIGSPLRRQLMLKHADTLEDDVSNRMWAMLGTAVHSILEKNLPEGSISEMKFEHKIGLITLSGIMDLYHNGVISDYKITSVWSYIFGDKPEWEAQLNTYAFLCEDAGLPVEKLEINAILRDWSKYGKGDNYPAMPFQRIPVKLWSKEQREEFIIERMRLHFDVEATECTPEEKWQRPTTYRVLKKGRKTAVRVFETQEEADFLIATNKDYYLEIRQGVCMRCKDYCAVAGYCPYYTAKEGHSEEVSDDVSQEDVKC